jgi:ketosteroid isomerase-like protein
MSQESTSPDVVELVRGTVDSANKRDTDGLMAFYAPDALMDGTRTVGSLWQGQSAIRGLVEDWRDAYDDLEWATEDLVDIGNGVGFAVVFQKASPLGVAGQVHQREGWIWVWVNDLIASVTFYPEAQIDEARRTAERLAAERE